MKKIRKRAIYLTALCKARDAVARFVELPDDPHRFFVCLRQMEGGWVISRPYRLFSNDPYDPEKVLNTFEASRVDPESIPSYFEDWIDVSPDGDGSLYDVCRHIMVTPSELYDTIQGMKDFGRND